MLARDKQTGQFKKVYVKALDSMPVGTEVDFDGSIAEVPVGWEMSETIDDYTTSQTFTGKHWIDGKKIYRKVLEGTTGSAASTWTTIGTINDIDEITSLTGILGKYLPIPQYTNSSYLVSLQNNNGNIQVFAVGYLSTPVKIIVEYTKTTEEV